MIRLQKYLADCGVASRRKSEELIVNGRVRVNGQLATELGTRVNPEVDVVALDGAPVTAPKSGHVYYLFNKPRGYLVSASDPFGRKTIFDLLGGIPERVIPVGRLDLDSEGLLLLTNDGELAHRLMHPKFRIEKEYEVVTEGKLTPEAVRRLEVGVEIEGGKTQPAEVSVLSSEPDQTRARIVIREGRKRQVRQMFAAVGHPVRQLRRIREGKLQLGSIPKGKFRPLADGEIAELKKEAGLA